MQAAAMAGPLVGAIGQIHQANANANAADYNANMAQMNATASINQANEMERRNRISSRQQIGAATAGYGASGVSMEGSPLDVLENSAANAELDALTIRHKGQMQAWGYGSEANLYRNQAGNDRTSGYINATSTLLGGGATALSSGKGSSKSAAPSSDV